MKIINLQFPCNICWVTLMIECLQLKRIVGDHKRCGNGDFDLNNDTGLLHYNVISITITLKNDEFITMIELNNHIPHPSSLFSESSQKFQLAQHYFTIHNTLAECISFTLNNML